MSEKKRGRPKVELPWSLELIRNIAERKYRKELGPAGEKRMVEDDGDNGEKLRARAGSYDPLVIAWLRVITAEPVHLVYHVRGEEDE